jgi:hypothetical protein
MPELGTYGSVRGAAGNSRPYRECRPRRTLPRARAAGVRKPPGEETAMWERVVAPRSLWGFGCGGWGFEVRFG